MRNDKENSLERLPISIYYNLNVRKALPDSC